MISRPAQQVATKRVRLSQWGDNDGVQNPSKRLTPLQGGTSGIGRRGKASGQGKRCSSLGTKKTLSHQNPEGGFMQRWVKKKPKEKKGSGLIEGEKVTTTPGKRVGQRVGSWEKKHALLAEKGKDVPRKEKPASRGKRQPVSVGGFLEEEKRTPNKTSQGKGRSFNSIKKKKKKEGGGLLRGL